MTNTNTTLVVIDPSSPNGEAGIEALDANDARVALILPLYGRRSKSLKEFANAENIGISTAGSLYLDQIAERIDRRQHDLSLVSTDGYNFEADILAFAAKIPVGRIIIPASLAGAGGLSLNRLATRSSVPLSITAA